MKTVLLSILVILLFVCNGYGQESENVISVTIPEQEGLDRSQMQILESIAIDSVMHSGYISAYKTWANTMKTLFLIEDENLVQSNKRSMVVIDAKLALNLRLAAIYPGKNVVLSQGADASFRILSILSGCCLS
jgi:hypothetical protein